MNLTYLRAFALMIVSIFVVTSIATPAFAHMNQDGINARILEGLTGVHGRQGVCRSIP
ncbi:hypothetical protein [Natronoglycomyces albus]|uniref:Uncharacterized protein n=1 Tax=Natronoglycomyces albus TaxID=2811108 RepID=A0A895XDY6_9ACTN|nr:hypothetical protein [Natronoglycomyces albus]QSB04021.1 hypothetical protein JQS30_09310 [Natronoglycomyces albus]